MLLFVFLLLIFALHLYYKYVIFAFMSHNNVGNSVLFLYSEYSV